MQLNTIYNEDCLETMKRMPDGFVDLVLTDPPYGYSFMGKVKWNATRTMVQEVVDSQLRTRGGNQKYHDKLQNVGAGRHR